MGSKGRGSLFGAKDNASMKSIQGVRVCWAGGGGAVKRNCVAAAEDTDPEIQGKLGSGMQSCELPVKPSKSQKSSLRKKCQGKKNKGLSPKYVFHGRWKSEKKKDKGRLRDFPGGPGVKTPSSQCREPGFDPWSGN